MSEERKRFCAITSASIEFDNGAGDGAYSLHGVHGSPEEVGAAIVDALKEGDMCQGNTAILNDSDGELYLTLRIKFANHEVTEPEEV